MPRTIIDLDARASVLDAAEKVSDAPADGDLALVVAPGAPLLRSAIFLDVLRGMVGTRRLSIVTTDGRARSIASSAHIPAYASIAALERHELDPTERLTPARRAAIASVRSDEQRRGVTTGRIAGATASVAGAVILLLAVVLPEATVTVAPSVAEVGPVEVIVRPGAIPAEVLTAQMTVRIPITATGQRITETRGKGTVLLRNKTTTDITIPRGTIFSTASGTQFLSTEERRLPRSFIVGNFEIDIGDVDVPVEAAVAGDPGNVPAGTIVNGPQPDRYTVTNEQATSGGVITNIPVMRAEDYEAARVKAAEALQLEATAQLERWNSPPPQRRGEVLQVVDQVLVRQDSLAPASVDVIGKEIASIEMTVTGTATAYAFSGRDFENEVLRLLAAGSLPAGREIAAGSELIQPETATVSAEGVEWKVIVSAAHQASTDEAAIERLIVGRPAGEAEAILEGLDLRVRSIERSPSWWPLLPLLDGRIDIRFEGESVTQGR